MLRVRLRAKITQQVAVGEIGVEPGFLISYSVTFNYYMNSANH